MHTTWKPAHISIQTPNTSHTSLGRQRERAMMTINATRIIAIMTLLARRLARNDAKPFQLSRVEAEVMVVRTFVGLASIVVAASDPNVVLVAGLQLLDALDFFAVIFEIGVEALPFLVALDCDNFFWLGDRTHVIGHRKMGTLVGDGSPRP